MNNNIFAVLIGEIDTGISTGGIFQLILILILFVLIFFGAYYTSRFLGGYQMKKNKNANLKIIEAISVGPQKTVQIVKVGSEFVLIGVSKERITYIKTIDSANIDLSTHNRLNNPVPFNKYLDKFIKSKKETDE